MMNTPGLIESGENCEGNVLLFKQLDFTEPLALTITTNNLIANEAQISKQLMIMRFTIG